MTEMLKFHSTYSESVRVAREKASLLYDEKVYPRHLLLGVILTDNLVSHVLTQLLQENGAAITDLQGAIEESLSHLHKARRKLDPAYMEYGKRSQHTFDLANFYACKQGFTEVRCEHLLFAIYEIQEETSKILENMYLRRREVGKWISSVHNF